MSEEEIDREVERVLALSDEEVRAEIVARGLDPDECVRVIEEAADRAFATYYRSINRLN